MRTTEFSGAGRGNMIYGGILFLLLGIFSLPIPMQGQVDVTDIYFSTTAPEPTIPADSSVNGDNQTELNRPNFKGKPVSILLHGINNTLQVTTNPDVELLAINMIDLSGKQTTLAVRDPKEHTQTLSTLPPGYYVIRVETSAGWLHKNICLL